jgi:hypothetical protein
MIIFINTKYRYNNYTLWVYVFNVKEPIHSWNGWKNVRGISGNMPAEFATNQPILTGFNTDFPLDPSLMELLAIPPSRQKMAASGWLSQEGGNPAKKQPAKRTKFGS